LVRALTLGKAALNKSAAYIPALCRSPFHANLRLVLKRCLCAALIFKQIVRFFTDPALTIGAGEPGKC